MAIFSLTRGQTEGLNWIPHLLQGLHKYGLSGAWGQPTMHPSLQSRH